MQSLDRALVRDALNARSEFHLFAPAHLVAILLTLTLPFVLAAWARRAKTTALDRTVRTALALLLTMNFIGYGVRASLSGSVTWQQTLPCQLCDWTMIAVIVALLVSGEWKIGGMTSGSSRSTDGTERVPPKDLPRALLEPAYFWGIGGSLQAVLTPNLQFAFPDYRFISFFVDHCGIVIGVTYLMVSRRFRPHLASAWRTLLWSEVYLAVALVVDWITAVNYGFLLHKPEAFSILSYLSDWRPLYIAQLNLLALVFFALLYAPFAIFDFVRGNNEESRKQLRSRKARIGTD